MPFFPCLKIDCRGDRAICVHGLQIWLRCGHFMAMIANVPKAMENAIAFKQNLSEINKNG